MRLSDRLLALAARPGSTFLLMALVLAVAAFLAWREGDAGRARDCGEGVVGCIAGFAIWGRVDAWLGTLRSSR